MESYNMWSLVLTLWNRVELIVLHVLLTIWAYYCCQDALGNLKKFWGRKALCFQIPWAVHDSVRALLLLLEYLALWPLTLILIIPFPSSHFCKVGPLVPKIDQAWGLMSSLTRLLMWLHCGPVWCASLLLREWWNRLNSSSFIAVFSILYHSVS